MKIITLKKFRGLNRPGVSLDGMKEFAFITSTIEVELSDNYLYAETFFHPSRSYVFNKRLIDKGLLTHELYHLHITEYCSRLLKKNIYEKRIWLEKEILEMKDHILEVENIMQRQYDNDSYHGYVLEQQKKWERNVDSLLISLDGYKESKIKLRSR